MRDRIWITAIVGVVMLLIVSPAAGTAVVNSPPVDTARTASAVDSAVQDVSQSSSEPSVSISYDTGDDDVLKIGEDVEFEVSTTGLPSGVEVEWYDWDLGREELPNGSLTGPRFSHVFVRDGTYNISVTAHTDYGNEYIASREITIQSAFADVPFVGDRIRTHRNKLYRLDVSEGQSFALDSYVAAPGRGDYIIYGPDGELIQEKIVADYGRVFGATVDREGPYYIGIDIGPTNTVARLRPIIREPDRFEPNQDRSTATVLDPDASASMLTLTESQPVDWYAVNVERPTRIDVTADQRAYIKTNFDVAQQTEIGVQIFDSDGTPIGRITPDDESGQSNETEIPNGDTWYGGKQASQVAEVDSGGTYYIRVKGISRGFGVTQPLVDGLSEYNLSVTSTPLGQQSFGRDSIALTERIEVEHFDTGGEGVAYHDTSDGNRYETGYRNTDVDVRVTQDTSDYKVGYFQEGEWLEYTVDSEPGTYDVRIRVATKRTDRRLRLSLGGETLRTVNVPTTGDWTNWRTVVVEDVEVSAQGRERLRVEALNNGIDVNWIEFAEADDSDGRQAFNRGSIALTSRIEAENFDTGGEGIAYHDTSDGNRYETGYRNTDVDVRVTQDSSDYKVGYFQEGEWLEYTVDSEPGTYDMRIRVATKRTDRRLRISLGGETLRTVNVPTTGDWTNWRTIVVEDVEVSPDGRQSLRLEALNNGIDINWIEFERTGG